VNPRSLQGNLHHHGGSVFCVIALLPMALILVLLRQGEKPCSAMVRNTEHGFQIFSRPPVVDWDCLNGQGGKHRGEERAGRSAISSSPRLTLFAVLWIYDKKLALRLEWG
jgi:hypothetical protein